VVVGALLIVVARAPVVGSHGTVRLRPDADGESVVESFTGPTPPSLVFQWGLADEIVTEDETATYRVSYLFGLRSVEVTVEIRTAHTSTGDHQIELKLAVGASRGRRTSSPSTHKTARPPSSTSRRRIDDSGCAESLSRSSRDGTETTHAEPRDT
jgi:hypothetical protein